MREKAKKIFLLFFSFSLFTGGIVYLVANFERLNPPKLFEVFILPEQDTDLVVAIIAVMIAIGQLLFQKIEAQEPDGESH